jgi:predicted nucleic acid-binding protein
MTRSSYPNPVPVRQLIERLRDATRSSYHEFWPDDVSLLDPLTVDAGRVLGPKQITDLYLLALAVRRDGLLVTFDAAIAPGAIVGAERRHIVSL